MRSINQIIAEGQLETLASFLGVRALDQNRLRFLQSQPRFQEVLEHLRTAARDIERTREHLVSEGVKHFQKCEKCRRHFLGIVSERGIKSEEEISRLASDPRTIICATTDRPILGTR